MNVHSLISINYTYKKINKIPLSYLSRLSPEILSNVISRYPKKWHQIFSALCAIRKMASREKFLRLSEKLASREKFLRLSEKLSLQFASFATWANWQNQEIRRYHFFGQQAQPPEIFCVQTKTTGNKPWKVNNNCWYGYCGYGEVGCDPKMGAGISPGGPQCWKNTSFS